MGYVSTTIQPVRRVKSWTSQNPIGGLSDDERTLLEEALRALRRERGAAWNAACDAAEAQAKRPPSLRTYGINDIRRLARRLGIRATHWMEE